MIRRPPRPPIKTMQPIALDLANSVTLLELHRRARQQQLLLNGKK